MYRLKLIKGKTYWGAGVKASQEKPYVEVETKEHAQRLLKTGHFVLDGFGESDEAKEEENAVETDEENDLLFPDEEEVEEENSKNSILDELRAKKVDELVKYASDCGIDISGLKKKEDIVLKIGEALAKAAEARESIRSEE